MRNLWLMVFVLFTLAMATPQARAANVIVGVNVEDVQAMSPSEQDALIAQLRENGVKTVRVGFDSRFTRFIIQAFHQGIGCDAIVSIKTSNAHMRPANKAVGLTWAEAPLSDADPAAFKSYVTGVLAPLDAAGVRLTALELGNEINNPHFNGDFFAPGTHRILGIKDLNNPDDKEGQAIARGYKVYIQLLTVLKDARDHSTANRSTPIISAGLADGGLPGKHPGFKIDGVSIPATIEFLRQNGMDNLVDGYGVHVYPSDNLSKTVANRVKTLDSDTFAACVPGAKPCWLTEWGFNNSNASCPIDDGKRVQLINTMHKAFQQFASDDRLAAVIYFSWSGHKGANESEEAIFRCGAVTEAGRAALAPL